MIINKDVKGVIKFLLLFLFVCLLPYLILVSNLPKLYSDYLTSTCDPDIRFCGAVEFILIMLGLKIIQSLTMLIVSIKTIKLNNNPLLLKIFNTFKVPFLILLICVNTDILVNMWMNNYNLHNKILSGREYIDVDSYNIFCSLTVNFAVVFIVALINNIRLFIKSKFIFKH